MTANGVKEEVSDTVPIPAGEVKGGPELIFGFVGAIGTDLNSLADILAHALEEVSYSCEMVEVIELLRGMENFNLDSSTANEEERIRVRMNEGDRLRRVLERKDALAILSVIAIRASRELSTGSPNRPRRGHAYVLKSLKHPAEAEKLRKIYGLRFVLIGAYSPRETRRGDLIEKLSASHGKPESGDACETIGSVADELIERDEEDVGNEYGQKLGETFPLADFFIDLSRSNAMQEVQRFVALLFQNPFHTPKIDEYGMFHARGAAVRSADLGRQVGAAIVTPDRELVALGTNEVPKAYGGLYGPEDENEQRDFVLGYDSNDMMKRTILLDLLENLARKAATDPTKGALEAELKTWMKLASDDARAFMQDMQLRNVLEFGRGLHAEMAALMDAVKRGVSVHGCILYTTTFPCHNCAKHILAAGIGEVVYIERYAKSLVADLYGDSVVIDDPETNLKVNFRPFVGVAPRRYLDLFAVGQDDRKLNGKILSWPRAGTLRQLSYGMPTTLFAEQEAIKKFCENLKAPFGFKKGRLETQVQQVEQDVEAWPEWMREEAGFSIP